MQTFVIDSISAVTHEMRDQIVVTGSHGGRSAAHLALAHPPAFVIFNDAGVGLDNAGIAGLEILQLILICNRNSINYPIPSHNTFNRVVLCFEMPQ